MAQTPCPGDSGVPVRGRNGLKRSPSEVTRHPFLVPLEFEANAKLNFTLGERSSEPKRPARRNAGGPMHVEWLRKSRTDGVVHFFVVGAVGDVESLRHESH